MVTLSMGDLDGNSQASASFKIHLSDKVRANQQIGLQNALHGQDYSVTCDAGVTATGTSSGAPPVEANIQVPISITAVAKTPVVAPGGLLTYTFTLSNYDATTAQHPVAVVNVPDSTRFSANYSTGAATETPGVAYVGKAGSPAYERVFYENGDKSQVVIALPALLAHPNKNGQDAVSFNVTFQVEWTDPVSTPQISTSDYLGAFVQNSQAAAFANAYKAAKGTTASTPSQTDFTAYLANPNLVSGFTENGSGVVSANVQGGLGNEPRLGVLKTISSTMSNVVEDGQGNQTDLVHAGDEITFALVAGNLGKSVANDVYIEDVMPKDTAFVSGSAKLLSPTLPGKPTKSTTESQPTFQTIQDPDGHHLRFVGLTIEPDDIVTIEYTVKVFNGTAAPAPGTLLNPDVFVDTNGVVYQSSIGSSSTPTSGPGIYASGSLEVFSASQFAQPVLHSLLPTITVSANPATTATTLDALYKNTPNALPLVAAGNATNFIPGVERYYIHYQNTGKAVKGATLEVPMPAHTVFYRASWVTLEAPQFLLPGVLAKPPTGGSISAPQVLSSGTILFKLPPLSIGQTGDVMVEVIVKSDAISASGAIIGNPTDLPITIHDSTVTTAGIRKLDDNSFDQIHTHFSQRPYDANGANDQGAPNATVPTVQALVLVTNFIGQGQTYSATVVVANRGNVDAHVSVAVPIPVGTEYVSADAGQSSLNYSPGDGDVTATLASGNGVVSEGDVAPLKAHTAAALTVTLKATGAAGTSILLSHVNVRVDNYGTIIPNPKTISVIAPGTLGVSGYSDNLANGVLFQTAVGGLDVGIIDLGGGNIVAAGGGNIVAAGGGNIVAAGGGNIVAQGQGSSISIGNTTAASLSADMYSIVAAGGGNIIVSTGAQIVAAGGGNIVAAGGGNIVAAGGGNLTDAGGLEIVAAGGGNYIIESADQVRGAGEGNIIAAGGGNVVNTNGSNDSSSTGGSSANLTTALGNSLLVGGTTLVLNQ
jgi:uncharacterized repeat protein (TIGR01451 family)